MLTLESLSKKFKGGNFGVRDVSMSVSGGVLGLLGPNGAGKTTLMQMIATITRPTAGTIRFQDIDAVRDPDRPRTGERRGRARSDRAASFSCIISCSRSRLNRELSP